MSRNLLDLVLCTGCAVHMGYWQPPAYLCPTCAAASKEPTP